MKDRKSLFTVLIVAVAAALAIPSAIAQDTVHILAVGASATFQGFEIATVNDLAPSTPTVQSGGSIHHFSFKSTCPGSACETVLKDPRTNPSIGPIPNEPSNFWVVWTCPASGCTGSGSGSAVDIWAYHSVDSTIGIRAFLSRPNDCTNPCHQSAVLSLVDSGTSGTGGNTADSGQNVVNPSLLLSGVASWGTGDTTCPAGSTTCDDEFIPTDVYNAISGASGVAVNSAMTDIRPEDAKAATKRANGPASNNVSLGYGTVGSQLIGAAIQSSFSGTLATPVEFGLPGLPDPITSTGSTNGVVPGTIQVIPVGQAPIIFIANRLDSNGLGAPDTLTGAAFAYTDLEDDHGATANRLSLLFDGYDCAGDATTFHDSAGNASFGASGLGANFPVHLIQFEALAGSMNTAEWTEFRTHGTWNVNPSAYPLIAGGKAAAGGSQEYNIQAALGGNNNPLFLDCAVGPDGVTTGKRLHSVGTAETVSAIKGTVNGKGFTQDNLGYIFFSFGNVKSISKTLGYGYLTIDQVDPIFAGYTGSEPGQPGNGELPACTPPNCNTSSIWNNALGSFPNLRNGSYRAWSLLRGVCDTFLANCNGSDAFGLPALIQAVQKDISNPTSPTAVADFLPYSETQYVRAHYNLLAGSQHADPFVHFFDQPMVNPSNTTDTLDVAATALENGGDAGGCLLPINFSSSGSSGFNANDAVLSISKAASVSGQVQYTYTQLSGTPLTTLATTSITHAVPLSVSVTGFVNARDGVFNINKSTVTSTTFRVTNGVVSGLPNSITPPTGGNASAGNGNTPSGATNTQCFQ